MEYNIVVKQIKGQKDPITLKDFLATFLDNSWQRK